MFYAQINGSNIVIGISQLSGTVSSPSMISIASFDISLMGKTYNAGTGLFT